MRSHEVLQRAIEPVGAKAVAHALKVSSSLVYKWCEPEDASGARNPLDRIAELIDCTRSPAPLEWLCKRGGGFFVRDPQVPEHGWDAEYVVHTQTLLQRFSELLQVVSEAIKDDAAVDAGEARRIRAEWEELKASTEGFVIACERGLFAPRANPKR